MNRLILKRRGDFMNPYEAKEEGLCYGCNGEIYTGEPYRIIRDTKGQRHKVHDDYKCLCEAVGAITPEEDRDNRMPLKATG